MEGRVRCVRRPPAGRASLSQVAPRARSRRRRRCSRCGAELAGTGRARRDSRGRRRRACTAGALLASGARTAPRRLGRGPLGRAGERLEAPARRVPRGAAGRRSAASSSPHARTSSPRSSRTATCAGRLRARAFASRAGPERRPIRASRTSTAGCARVVAGDGTGDRLVSRLGTRGRLAWRPGAGFVLAYTTAQAVRRRTSISRRVGALERAAAGATVDDVEWSIERHAPARRLAAATSASTTADGRLVDRRTRPRAGRTSTWRSDPERRDAVARVHGSQSSAYILSGRSLTNVTGRLVQLEWAPDGRWLLVAWETADQWILVRADGNYPRGRERLGAVPLALVPARRGLVLRLSRRGATR